MKVTLPRMQSLQSRRRALLETLDEVPYVVVRSTTLDEREAEAATIDEHRRDVEEEYEADDSITANAYTEDDEDVPAPAGKRNLAGRQIAPPQVTRSVNPLPLLNTMSVRMSTVTVEAAPSTVTVSGAMTTVTMTQAAPVPVAPVSTAVAVPTGVGNLPIAEENVAPAPVPTAPTTTDSLNGGVVFPTTADTLVPTITGGLGGLPGLAGLVAQQVAASAAAQSQAAAANGQTGDSSGAVVVAVGVTGGLVAALLVITCAILRCNRKEKEAKKKTVV